MKHLKTFLAALLALVLFSGICACAEELPYMQQLSQDKYILTMFLTTDSYPEVCISPSYFNGIYIGQYAEPCFVHFPCPPNTFVSDFSATSCSFIDMSYNRQYVYAVHDSAAYETFINEAEKDEYILADGAGDVASYLEPDRCRAHALVAARDIGKSAKVEILIGDDSLEGKSEAQIVESLSAQITAEAARVQASLRVDMMPVYWTQGRYAGFKQICDVPNTDGLILTYTLPEGYIISEMTSGEFTICKIDGKDNAISAKISLDTHDYVDYQLEDDPNHVTTAVINGAQYRIYSHWYEDKEIISAYADCFVAENAGYGADEPLELIFEVETEGDHEWLNVEDVQRDLTEIVAGVQLDFGQNIPDYREAQGYTDTASAAEAPAEPAVDAPAAAEAPAEHAVDVPAEPADDAGAPSGDEAWTCADCGSENHGGKFCPNCGSPRPAQPLVCANCGYQVPEGETPKFCANCGNPF